MKAAKIISGLLAVFIGLPIWYYLVHFMLVHSGAGELQMFLFWVYVPLGIFIKFLDHLVERYGIKS